MSGAKLFNSELLEKLLEMSMEERARSRLEPVESR